MASVASDFDGAWKYALEEYFEPFLALFFNEAHAAVDWTQPFSFRDAELQQLAIRFVAVPLILSFRWPSYSIGIPKYLSRWRILLQR
jgi:hypothetical protein